jgi:translation initiation factor IF-2
MRARGTSITDIVALVIAADEGIMDQTVEAIELIQEAKLPMVVVINKVDKSTADVNKVKQQLLEYDIAVTDYGKTNEMKPQ